jgi:hypothetical protein
MAGRYSKLAAALIITISVLVLGIVGIPASGETSTSLTSSSTSSASNITTHHSTVTFVLYPCNCSINLQPALPTYSTLGALKSASFAVVVGQVTSERTVGVNMSGVYGTHLQGLVPVTFYNVSVTASVSGIGGTQLAAWLPVAQIGGAFDGTIMNVTGYPSLSDRQSYVFFLSLPGSFLPEAYGQSLITTGGAQGLFYVQGGDVYSLDRLFPQADSWLPVKVDGLPLGQFISEVQSVSSTSTTATTPVSTTSQTSATSQTPTNSSSFFTSSISTSSQASSSSLYSSYLLLVTTQIGVILLLGLTARLRSRSRSIGQTIPSIGKEPENLEARRA